MSTTYTGARSITGTVTSAGTFSIVTTSAPHGLANGDHVHIEGQVNDPQVNGPWTVAAVGSTTTFQINNASFVAGTGNATGTVTVNRSAITIPSDGDPRNAMSVDVALEGLADAVADLIATQGKYFLADIKTTLDASPSTALSTVHANLHNLTPGVTVYANDVIETSIMVGLGLTNVSGTVGAQLGLSESFAGGSFTGNATGYVLLGANRAGVDTFTPTIMAYTLIASAQAGTYASELFGGLNIGGGGSGSGALQGSLVCVQKIWRRR